MAPRGTKWEELDVLTEKLDDENGQFQYTKFLPVTDNDGAYFGQLNRPKLAISRRRHARSRCKATASVRAWSYTTF